MAERMHKTALITGGSTGLGFEFASLLAEKGYDIVIAARTESKLQQAKANLQQKYPDVEINAIVLDVSKPKAAEELYAYCKQNNIDVEILINNAGTFIVRELLSTSEDSIFSLLNLHITTPTLLCRYFGNEMKEKKSGYILNVSSLTAYTPYPTISIYGASKKYLKDFTKALKEEMKPYQVGVTELCPGGVATDLLNKDKAIIRLATRLHILMPAKKVAKKGLKAMFKKKKKTIPGFFYRISPYFLKCIPNGFIVFLYKHTSLFSNKLNG